MQLTIYLTLANNKQSNIRTIKKYLNKYLVNIYTLNFKTFILALTTSLTRLISLLLPPIAFREYTISYKMQQAKIENTN